ncbi:MAG: sigma-70 family RNA polymerase sigma factor [Rikenellaceae bacterium]|nr:sigma-70 family RNA polymerase sigma factor [Rikenellaceae bacterium]
MSEKQQIKRCQQGDAKALKEIYERYATQMLGVCYRYVNNRETARDLLHDGFITVFTKIGDFRGEGSFEGWLRRIFVTTSLGYLRKNANFQEDARPVDEMYDLRHDGASALEAMSAQELVETIGQMPDGYRTVLNLYAVEGYSHKEIAELLHISEATSRSQYSRARTFLQKNLKKMEAV